MHKKSLTVLFPLSAMAAAIGFALTGCGSDGSSSSSASSKSISFSEIAYPASDAEKRAISASTTATVNDEAHTIGYTTILRSGQQSGTGTFGLMYDINGQPLVMTDGSQYISDSNDHSTLIDTQGKIFMVSQFESANAGFYITELSQDSATGTLTAVGTKPIDFSAVYGGWTHCAGMRTPWKTHLGSEEYEPDARIEGSASRIAAYFGEDSNFANYVAAAVSRINPYNYGFPVEVSITGADMGSDTFAGNVAVAKHYSMGRTANELSYVMPDRKTVYITDDGTMVGLFKYVADTAEKLSAGTLYAAKLTQTAADNGGAFTVSWIKLDHATDSEVRTIIDSGIKFEDIFDAATPAVDADGNYSCPEGYTGVSHGHASLTGGSNNECLVLKTGMDKAAAFLETRRYAALKGATLELNKEEGVTFDPDNMKMYIAMSDVTKGMLANASGTKSKSEAFSRDDIHLTENRCGTVYELALDKDYSATTMTALISGTAASYEANSPYVGNTCDVNGLANPDNVTFMPGYKTLIIGEDTGSGHQTDLIWSYNLADKTLTRIQSTPYGSETTSPYFYPNVNGFAYLMSVIQHPYGESDEDKIEEGSAERRAYTGYIGPFPAMD